MIRFTARQHDLFHEVAQRHGLDMATTRSLAYMAQKILKVDEVNTLVFLLEVVPGHSGPQDKVYARS